MLLRADPSSVLCGRRDVGACCQQSRYFQNSLGSVRVLRASEAAHQTCAQPGAPCCAPALTGAHGRRGGRSWARSGAPSSTPGGRPRCAARLRHPPPPRERQPAASSRSASARLLCMPSRAQRCCWLGQWSGREQLVRAAPAYTAISGLAERPRLGRERRRRRADGHGDDLAAAGRLAGAPGLGHAALLRRRARHR